MKSKHQEFMHL
jgi:hypothetical protein